MTEEEKSGFFKTLLGKVGNKSSPKDGKSKQEFIGARLGLARMTPLEQL